MVSPKFLDNIYKLISDSNINIKSRAIYALQFCGEKAVLHKSFTKLIRLLNNKDGNIKNRAGSTVIALSKYLTKDKAIKYLIQISRDEEQGFYNHSSCIDQLLSISRKHKIKIKG